VRNLNRILPGLDSYRGRYAYLAFLAGLALMTIALIGWVRTQHISQTQIEAITQRTHTASLLTDAQTQLNLLENHLQRFVIEPTQSEINEIHSLQMILGSTLDSLSGSLVNVSAGQSSQVSSLLAKNQQLASQAELLIEVRGDIERWFPAARLMQVEMMPRNETIMGELQNMLQESETGLSLQDRLQAMEILTVLRRDWLGVVEEMHQFLAYRLGIVISSPQAGNENHHDNMLFFAKRVETHLQKLKAFSAEVDFGIDMPARIERLENEYKLWINASNQVVVLMDNSDWRRDQQLLRDSIDPILRQMRDALSVIDLSLDKASASEITRLTETTEQLSASIFSIALMGILMILVAYLYINRNLLLPIAQTAQALKEEAKGTLDVKPPPADLRETRDLVEAFNEMRSQVHQRQRYLDHIAHHDALTQLPNRVLFRDRLEHALAIALRGETQVGLMFLDLDQFKQVNDSLGHLVGDELLKRVAERLTSLVRNSDTVARLGGDEFAILLEGINSREDMSLLAKKILRIIEQPLKLDGQELRISVSIGIATAPHDDVSAEYLIRDADAAMYEAKRQGRAAYHFFSGELTYRASENLQRENQVRKAAEQGEFTFHFQPVVDSRSGELFCFEALMRWQHPSRGLLYPDDFLTVMDETGVIGTVIDPLLKQAIAFQQEQFLLRGESVGIAINLSVRLLNDQTFRQMLLERLIAHDFLPGSLILEITEDILMQDLVEADVFLRQLKTLGTRIAIDDFGTGQASLSHLRQFPFDLLKIDREFIRNVDADSNDASLVKAMIQLSHAFGIKVVAEGVETEAQLDFLRQQDCDYIQGYLISVPNHAEHPFQLEEYLPLFAV